MLYTDLKPSQFVVPQLNPPYILKRQAVSAETAETTPHFPLWLGVSNLILESLSTGHYEEAPSFATVETDEPMEAAGWGGNVDEGHVRSWVLYTRFLFPVREVTA